MRGVSDFFRQRLSLFERMQVIYLSASQFYTVTRKSDEANTTVAILDRAATGYFAICKR